MKLRRRYVNSTSTVASSCRTKNTVFWDVTPSSLVDWYQRVGGTSSLHLVGRMSCVEFRNVGISLRGYTASYSSRPYYLRLQPEFSHINEVEIMRIEGDRFVTPS
jgi:hypothetical protein